MKSMPHFAFILAMLMLSNFAHPQAQETSPIFLAVPSGDETLIAISARDGTIVIQDAKTGVVLSQLIGHTDSAIPIWSSDGRKIVSTSTDTTARLWDVATGRELSLVRRNDWVTGAVWLNNNDVYLSDNGSTGFVWNTESGAIRETGFAGWNFAFSPDKTQFAAGRPSGVAIFDAASLEMTGEYEDLYDDDGQRLSNAENTKRKNSSVHPILAVEWQPDGNLIASGDTFGSVKLRDADTGEIVHEWSASDMSPVSASSHFVRDLAFSDDGQRLYSIAEDGTLRVWDVRSGELLEETQTGHIMTSAVFTQALDRLFYVEYHVVEVDGELARQYDATDVSQFSLKP